MGDSNGRIQRLFKNTGSSLFYQVITILCGFILPRVILKAYGSDVNGLINSISQFLTVITLLDLGVGEVVRSHLYRPLLNKDYITISGIIISARKFFRKLAAILLIYVCILIVVFPFITDNEFDHLYTAVLVIAMSISSFTQYYFGMVNNLLLSADQKGYVQYNIQTITLIINTILCTIFIKLGFSIQFVKIITAFVYLIRPLYLQYYVDKHYAIDYKTTIKGEPIKQKWNGVAQHMSTVILNHTDTVVLTLLGTLAEVSIYSVYHLVVYGIKNLFDSMVTGVKPLLGELWARGNRNDLRNIFNLIEWVLHSATVFFFGCMAVLIVPFVSVYTSGVVDANYIQPVFAYLITAAYAVHCLRLPYNMLILAAGHFKQTQLFYTIAAALNVIVSVASVQKFGLIGVSMGTLCAMLFHTIWTALYGEKHLLHRNIKMYLKQIIVDVITVIVCVLVCKTYYLFKVSYFEWFILALKVTGTWIIIEVILNLIFYRKNMRKIINICKRRFFK